MNLKNKKVLVYGLCNSGEWVSKLLIKHKANVFLFDDDLTKLRNKSLKNCYLVQELNEEQIKDLDFIIVSPAIEQNNYCVETAKKYNIKIYSEVEFASQFCENYVAVTGTNGKTTTVEMIANILNKKYKAIACGNNGYSLSRAVLENKKYIKVVEVSSFMLENCEKFSPHVATILNIEPDHLIRHKTMDSYKNLKFNLFNNLTSKDFCVVNLDKKFVPKQNCKTLTYSYSKLADVRLEDGYITIKDEKLIPINKLKYKGKHNIYNTMCAICYGLIYNVKTELIKEAVLNFVPNSFRTELIAKFNNITFINDSKSTNIASTLASVEMINSSIILILCGSKKGLDYSKLFSKLSKKVKHIVVFGEIKQDVVQSNDSKFEISSCENLDEAFAIIKTIVKRGDTVLFSPSSASYDQFMSYVERGKFFNLKVKEYYEESNPQE